MHNWNNHYDRGFEAWQLLMPLTMILFLALGVWLIVALMRRSSIGSEAVQTEVSSTVSAQQILNERLARGEISEEEFASRTQALKAAGQ